MFDRLRSLIFKKKQKALQKKASSAIGSLQKGVERRFLVLYHNLGSIPPAEQLEYLKRELNCEVVAKRVGGGIVCVHIDKKPVHLLGCGPSVQRALADIAKKAAM